MMLDTLKHLLHCITLYTWIATVISMFPFSKHGEIDPRTQYGLFGMVVLYFVKCLPFLVIHQCVFQLIGLTFYNPFKQTVPLKSISAEYPYVCFRIVTRGLYPCLVKENIIINIDTCNKAGITKFIFEVVTDNAIGLPLSRLIREIVVPDSYKTKNGAVYKARALQYCIEEDVNRLKVHGILNFVMGGKHDFGQGLITYASGTIVNWLTTLSDSYRVADDCGKLRCQLSLLHAPIFGWKGSYVVARVGAERAITWDHGPEGSIAEDTFFGFLAMQAGYSFDFVEGEMLEKSPFTTMDFLQQRKRWLEGLLLVVHSKKISPFLKIPLALVVYSWMITPLTFAQFIIDIYNPLPANYVIASFLAFSLALNVYMNVFGVIRSFSEKNRSNIPMLLLCCVGSCLTLPYTVIIQAASVVLFVCSSKKKFHIVEKETAHHLQSMIV